MKITALTIQIKDSNRVNVMVDDRYRFSLDIFQMVDLGIKLGKEYTDKELDEIETESQFGKLYARALEYCLMRPHSAREVRDYLFRKTFSKKYRSKKTGEMKERPGVSKIITDRVYDRLVEKGHIDDKKFAHFWVENRNVAKGMSTRKLQAELASKGVDRSIIELALVASERDDEGELQKIIAKKRKRYPDEQKLIQYLARQGFNYDDIKSALSA
ncbi:MAG: RecX family transcriptional regulator [Candidatus Saccharimonadales bacterium]